jgi:transketolase
MNASQDFASSLRVEALRMVTRAKASHIGGALSMADILAVLYQEIQDPPRRSSLAGT